MVAATSQIAATVSAGPGLTRKIYYRWLTLIVVTVLVFRSALGARGSFTGDDFGFRADTAAALRFDVLFQAHNGHLNPLGLFAQWTLQHLFPGRYVPLMLLSAALVAAASLFIGVWSANVFGYRYTGLFAAAYIGLVLLELELATWWSVALYAAPLLACSTMLVWASTRYVLGRASLWLPATAFGLALLSSTKAVLLPILIFCFVAAYPLRTAAPLGFRNALSTHRRLWAVLAGFEVAYVAAFALMRGQTTTTNAGLDAMAGFVAGVLRQAGIPAAWGGPWGWFSLGFHGAPFPPPALRTAALLLTVLACAAALYLRPRVWRMLLGSAAYILLSAGMVAIGRAGGPLSVPVLRYTFDFALPIVLVGCLAVHPTRWEAGAFSSAGKHVVAALRAHPAATRITAAVLALTWLLSVAYSYWVPWRILPGVTEKTWVTNARSHYPALSGGILEQQAPSGLSLFAIPLSTFLSGDPGAPPQRQLVTDRLLGFDVEGHLIDQDVRGIPAQPPSSDCAYQAQGGVPATVPLTEALPPGRHTVAFDYLLSTSTPVGVALGGPVTRGSLPTGAHRAFAVVDGQGQTLEFSAANPGVSLCILNATVGWIQPGARVDPDSL